MTKLFLSGPLFTVAERDFNAGLAQFLTTQGFEVWLPQERVSRGGAFSDIASVVRSAERGWGVPTYSNTNVGFRLARTLPLK